MKQKLTLLLIALLTSMGAWAIDVTVIKSTESQTTYGSLSSGTFTTNPASGVSGVTVSGVTTLKNTSFAYGSSLGFESVTSGTITLRAPEGYSILGYSLIARSNTYSVSYTLTPAAGGSAVTTTTDGVTLTATGLNTQTTTISYSASKSNHFYIPNLVITMISDADEPVDVVYKEVYNGVVEVTNPAFSQIQGEAPSMPEAYRRAYCSYNFYATEACTGEEITELTSSTTEIFAKVTFTPPFTVSSAYDGATWYYVYFNRDAGKRYWQMDPENIPYPDKESKPSVSEALWAFIGNPYDGIKVMNARAGDGYYLTKTGTSSGNAITMQAGEEYWAIGNGNGGFYLKKNGTNVFVHDYSTTLAVWNSGSAATDKGSAIVVEDAAPVKVTYKLTFNGNVISSYTKDLYELVGATAAVPFDWELPSYCSFGSCSPSTITAETTEVTVPLNWDGPFTPSTDYAHAAWYYLKIGGEWVVYDESAPYSTYADKQQGDAALWAFINNPVDGFKIINKEAGDGYKLSMGTNVQMITGNTYTDYVIDREDANVFYAVNGDDCLSVYGHELVYYNIKDASCKITVDSYYKELYEAKLEEYEASIGKLFGITQSAFDTHNATIDASAITTENYYNIASSLLDGIAKIYPEDGHYYRIKSSGSRSIGASYIGYGSSDYGTGLRTVAAAAMPTDASTVIKFTGSNGTYKLSTENFNVQSQTGANAAFTATASTGVDFVFNVSSPGVVTICNEASASGDRQGCLHEGGDGTEFKGVVNWNPNADASKWTVEDAEEITLSLNEVSGVTYGTTYLPFGVTLPAGDVCAYTLTNLDNGWVRPVLLGTNGKSIPAGTPVLLRGTSTTSVTATIGDVAAISIAENMLDGTYVTMAPGNNLVLGKYEGVVGFYKYEHNIKPNKAYIPAGSYVKGFVLEWDDDPDAIVSPFEETEEGAAIYNVAGQRLNKMQKGINIVNGKKILK